MATLNMKTMQGAEAGTLELSDAVFSIEPNVNAIRAAYLVWAANQRQGTHSTKTRAFVRGGGKKPFKQKGTGRARQGTNRAPYMPGGAIIFGPHPRDYRQKINRKVRSLAFCSQLSDLMLQDRICVLDKLAYEAPKTKTFVSMMAALELTGTRRVLLLLTGEETNVLMSAQNMPNVVCARVEALSIYDLLICDKLVASADCLKKLEERIA